jgi:hypothetical protein
MKEMKWYEFGQDQKVEFKESFKFYRQFLLGVLMKDGLISCTFPAVH